MLARFGELNPAMGTPWPVEVTPVVRRDPVVRPPRSFLSFALLVGIVCTATALLDVGVLGPKWFSSSPHALAEGKVWLLVTSAFVAQPPEIVSLTTFAALGGIVLFACGARVLWLSALLGHMISTVTVYGLIALVRAVDPTAFERLVSAPDYGVSAVFAAWLGALASAVWQAYPRRSLRGGVVVGCVLVAVIAWLVRGRPQPVVFDSEHLFAFAVGSMITSARAALLVRRLTSKLAPVRRAVTLERHGA